MITPPRMGPKIGARSTGSPRTASARPTCCGPARCATSVNPIGSSMTPPRACSTRKAINSPAVSTARTGTSRHRRARSPRPRRLGAAALGDPSRQGSGPPARRGSDPGAARRSAERRAQRVALRTRQMRETPEHRRAQRMQARECELHLGLDTRRPDDPASLRGGRQVPKQGGLVDSRLAAENPPAALARALPRRVAPARRARGHDRANPTASMPQAPRGTLPLDRKRRGSSVGTVLSSRG
jgi:hypothetical protein